MNAVTLVLLVDVVSKSFQVMVKTALKPENAAGRVSTLCMEDVDYDA